MLHRNAAHLARTLPLQTLPATTSASGRLGIADDPIGAENVQLAFASGKQFWPPFTAFRGGGTNPDAASGAGEDGGKGGGGTNSGGGDSGSDDGGGSTPPVGWPPKGGTDTTGGDQTDDGGLTLLPSPPTEPGNNPGDDLTDGDGGGSVPHPPLPPIETVPEPATWGIFTLGLFAVGFLMRRRRVNRPSAAAS